MLRVSLVDDLFLKCASHGGGINVTMRDTGNHRFAHPGARRIEERRGLQTRKLQPIQMGRGPADACADEVFNHESAHHSTMGSYGADCTVKSRELIAAAGLSQRHVETWAQAYTQRYWG